MAQRSKKGTTERIVATFVDAAGALKTGLSVGVRVRRSSDGYFLNDDDSWTASPGTEYSATEVDATNAPGVYSFAFSLPDALDEYDLRFDGSSAAANRYQFGTLRAVAEGDGDLHVVKAVIANTQQQAIATGVVTVMDDDGVTPLLTLTPSVDDEMNPTKNVLTRASS